MRQTFNIMKNKHRYLFILIICLFYSCVTPSIEEVELIDITCQVNLVAPDFLLSNPNLSLEDALDADEDLELWLTSELYEIKGSKQLLLERCNEKYDVYTQTLNSYKLKSNSAYLLLYLLEFRKNHKSFYDIDGLMNIKLRGQNNTIDMEPNKEVFVGRKELKGGSKDFCDTIILKSPFSFYLLESTDLEAFIEKHADLTPDSIDVNVKYLSYYPCAFDVLAMKPVKSDRGIMYKRRVSVQSNGTGYLELGYDFLFMGEDRSIASVSVIIRDSYSQRILSSKNVEFDYFLRERKIVQGNFLTGSQNGIIIDTTFQDDIIIDF